MSSLRDELRELVRLSWPISLAHLGMVALGLVDVAILGHDSVSQLGGASVGRSIGFTSVALGMGVSAVIDPLAAQAIGAREPDRAWHALTATLKACALLWIPCTAIAIASTWLLAPFGIDAALVGPARAYLLGSVPGLLFFTIFLATKTFLQAHKRTGPALAAAVVANLVNYLACSVLVRGDAFTHELGIRALGLPRMGALGAGISYSLANLVLLAFAFVPALGHRAVGADPAPTLRKVFRLGAPIGLQLAAEIGVFCLIAVVAGMFGAVASAAHQIAIGLASLTFMAALGVSGATAVRVGHAVGERRSPRAAGFLGIGLGAALMSVGSIAFTLWPSPLIRLFTSDLAVVDLGASLLRIAAIFQLFDGVQGVCAGALRGAGDVQYPFLANVGAHWLVGLPIALSLGFWAGWGARGLWWGLTAGLIAIAVLLTRRFIEITRREIARV